MSDESGRTLVCSVLFLDLVGYSTKAVEEQHEVKQYFNRVLGEALAVLKRRDRVIVDTGDGAAIVFLGDPEDAIIVGLVMRESAGRIPMRMGINLGPVRLMSDLNEQTNVVGDGINVAQRVMSFAESGQLLVSGAYFEVVSRLSDHYRSLFTHVGTRQDKHVREHDVYVVDESIRIGDAPPDSSAPRRPVPREEPALVADAGPNLMISGRSRASVQAALQRLIAQGSKLVSPPSQTAGKWYAACSHPAREQFECTVEKLGLKRVVTGPTRQAVADKVADLRAFGATLVGDIEEVNGKWTAICDTQR